MSLDKFLVGSKRPFTATAAAAASEDVPSNDAVDVANKKQKTDMTRIAIIGSAGRKTDAPKMNKALYERMVTTTHNVITVDFKLDPKDVTLISGGAAWSDAVAVSLFIRGGYGGLQLYVPCDFTSKNVYFDNGERGSYAWKTNAGQTLNYYYKSFSAKMGRNMLLDIRKAITMGAVLCLPSTDAKRKSDSALHERNIAVAESAHRVIAYTWGPSEEQLADGGTKHTFEQCKGIRKHVPLHTV